MTTILNIILEEKEKEVERLKEEDVFIGEQPLNKQVSFLKTLQERDSIAIIAEFKRASPSKGNINLSSDPKTQALSYINYGADAISVLTDTSFFKGNFQDLTEVREAVDVPVLCKDFIIDEVQILKAKSAGANLILLIAAALEEQRLKELYTFAVNNGLEVLMEVHNEEELAKALQTGAQIIGVNNRDLKTFAVDLSVTEKLAPQIKAAGAFLISESGIKTEEDVQRVMAAGANGILVGEAFMRSDNLEALFKGMKQPLKERSFK
ncbi:indole-3-glycerol phosphate synthase TrpC [Bacillus sp. S/N-304-OC-R1]|uniref:indole-3-glycerol phosphate synthase TrpC n=1 Tax=Bacillus sp. S/N-304-OC-R1 TaxID=2758034 RepID=UPI001C8CFF9E|nr:indole-3-glycerol phosphate synthase TrpC [Bacillus sp. S/N-304-OC-R1]MBY0121361.1 indole-3-glycerol phosphate synthase TrpC [Bacillus sp. S/N-304-OC-R1]